MRFKTFEQLNLIEYPYDKMKKFVEWFNFLYKDRTKKENWGIFTHMSPRYLSKSQIGNNATWSVNARAPMANIMTSSDDRMAHKKAKDFGLMLDEKGVVIGYDNISFLEDPEYLKSFSKKLKDVQDADKFGI